MDGEDSEFSLPVDRSKKRTLPTPWPSPTIKRARQQQEDDQLLTNPPIHQPAPRSVTPSTVARLENLASSREHTINKVRHWLEATCLPDLNRGSPLRSDKSPQSVEPIITLRQIQSAPPIMEPPPTPLPHRAMSGEHSTTPAGHQRSSSAHSLASNSSAASKKATLALVEQTDYREMHLESNNIFYRDRNEPLPAHVSDLIKNVLKKPRHSPTPSESNILADSELSALEKGAGESRVLEYFQRNLIPPFHDLDVLRRSTGLPLIKNLVPDTGTGTEYSVSQPKPDILCGYNLSGAFVPQQRQRLDSMDRVKCANSENVAFPFLILELKGDGPSSHGRLWVATNQCLGGAATCVNIAERFNNQLRQYQGEEGAHQIDSTCFSVAMSGTEARLFVSWKQGEVINMRKVRSFALQEPDHFIEFRKHIRNIMDWGRTERLENIRSGLDFLIAESRRIIPKSRLAPRGNSEALRPQDRRDSAKHPRNAADAPQNEPPRRYPRHARSSVANPQKYGTCPLRRTPERFPISPSDASPSSRDRGNSRLGGRLAGGALAEGGAEQRAERRTGGDGPETLRIDGPEWLNRRPGECIQGIQSLETVLVQFVAHLSGKAYIQNARNEETMFREE
ncbi:hypothetical protein NM208_g4587 [Fusarium decemcellulare]|uniref:Uncharacterized protein n=2 Tax=Fusarium decemcellulare TaxID=57161 RepID=A0ACC1SKA0_9HYPO|nr:hypothetical protein NM208_g6264 [Fusarium decemcellulare]KAJ3541492.1 hypothetical protein NM208_g4587 [Fusarium decemcellulare]